MNLIRPARFLSAASIALMCTAAASAIADDAPSSSSAETSAASAAASDLGDPTQSPAIEVAGTTTPDVDRGKQVFRVKANCVNCHGWPGDGKTGRNPRSPGIPANLRETQLDTDTMIQVVSCGIPGTAMPYHDRQAYVDPRCYGTTKADYPPDQLPQPGHFLSNQEIVDVVAYVQEKLKGAGPITKAECEDFFHSSTASACKKYK